MKGLSEPEVLKKRLKALNMELRGTGVAGVDWDSLAAWYGNKLPSHLWNAWKDELRTKGFNWQKFLKLMSYNKKEMVLWATGELSWKDFVKAMRDSINGSIGELIRRG